MEQHHIRLPEMVSKFTPEEQNIKDRLFALRINKGLSMSEGATLLGISRKQLEDIETLRNYGRHIDVDLLIMYMCAYKVTAIEIVPTIWQIYHE